MNTPIYNCLRNNDTSNNPIWFMRQAGRYLPEFQKIRKLNNNFINLCLNKKLSSEITLQPLKRFNLDAAIIFSDILMIPYGLNQNVEFKKNFGPKLKDFNLEEISNINEKNFKKKLSPIYESINIVKNDPLIKKKDLIGFVGAPWTILVYMINCSSPKNGLKKNFFKDDFLIKETMIVIEKFIKLHIKNQIDAGANIIQIFDSWAGLLENKIPEYILNPTLNIVEYIKKLGVPVICFPRGIKNYKNFCDIVKPDAVNIDYEVDPKKIAQELKIPIQGGLDPKILLSDKENLKRKAKRYLDIFKDHPYIFNLGHGVLPQTKPEIVDYLVKLVKDFK